MLALLPKSAKRERHFAAKPGINWLLRPCVPGEFDEMDLSTISYTLVKRMGLGPEQLRIPMTEEMAQSWLDFSGKSGNIERSKWMGE